MKPVKNSALAVLLLSILAVSTFAGDIQTPGKDAPPPPPTNALVTSGGSAQPLMSEQSGETVETSDYLLFEALAALLSVY